MSNTSQSPTPVEETIGHRIRTARVNASMTQSQLGAELGCSSQQVHKYERGQNRVSAGTLFIIAQVLDYPVDWFFVDPLNPTAQNKTAPLSFH